MAYERVNWKDYPSTTTPINAENLNKMDKGIDDLDTAIGTDDISGAGTSVKSAIKNINSNLGDVEDDTVEGATAIAKIDTLKGLMGDQVTYTYTSSTYTLEITPK